MPDEAGRRGPLLLPPHQRRMRIPEFTRSTSPIVFMNSQSTGLELIGPPVVAADRVRPEQGHHRLAGASR